MLKGPFHADDFVATEFSTAIDKAAFGNLLLHFIDSGWKQTLFSKSFYTRLSMCFGHIAHYDRSGFYQTWFTCDEDRLRFLRHLLAWRCYGSPSFTFCDVERALQQELRSRSYLAAYELKAAEAQRHAELAMLERLEAKYRVPSRLAAEESLESTAPAVSESRADALAPVQASLF